MYSPTQVYALFLSLRCNHFRLATNHANARRRSLLEKLTRRSARSSSTYMPHACAVASTQMPAALRAARAMPQAKTQTLIARPMLANERTPDLCARKFKYPIFLVKCCACAHTQLPYNASRAHTKMHFLLRFLVKSARTQPAHRAYADARGIKSKSLQVFHTPLS